MMKVDTTLNSNGKYSDHANRVFDIESAAIAQLSGRITTEFDRAIDTILESKGRVIVCGMGKSGIIGQKISATLASTGTPSFCMHPAEAYHGDLGMVVSNDIFIAISNSGETDELIKLLPFLRENGNCLIAMTGNPSSRLALAANIHIDVGVTEEACPLQLAPTASTTATLAMGDAIAITLMEARGFRHEHFARFHPGGALGRRLLSRVDDEMQTEDLPFIEPNTLVLDLLKVITKGRLGIAIVQMPDGNVGVVTDGDVRRAFERFSRDVFDKTAQEIMSTNPFRTARGTRVADAIELMQEKQITSLLVVDQQKVVGVFKK